MDTTAFRAHKGTDSNADIVCWLKVVFMSDMATICALDWFRVVNFVSHKQPAFWHW